MDVWFLALTWQTHNGNLTIPRRLVWVVNRRVVVDQATNTAGNIVRNVANLPPHYREALRRLSVTQCEAPAISTLRGERADNREWTKDPSRPAIVIGTVDMIGSRLLFSGYRDGDYYRPQHAGLLGVDTLVINDEAHLTPAFVHLLKGISLRNPTRKIPGKTFQHISLSATHSPDAQVDRFPASLDDDIAESESFRTRVTGYKRLALHPVADNNKVEAMTLELAVEPGAPRTIVYIEQPQKALDMFRRIEKLHPGRVELLTGTMRGYERDRLLHTEVFKAMVQEKPPPEPVWLVATSAGEVGIDITSERQITSLVSADHLIQRFGRLNRYRTARGDAHLVYTQPKEKETALLKTLEYVQSLEELDGGRDIQCFALRGAPPGADAQTEPPVFADLHDWLIELWCQTSDPVKGYPPVESWLHGLQDEEGPETEVAWREDVSFLSDLSGQQPRLVLRSHRVLAREKLREPTQRLTGKLTEIAAAQPDLRVIVQYKDRSIEACTLEQLVASGQLDYALVLLPVGIGALVHGMFATVQSKDAESPNDVADVTADVNERRRQRFVGVKNQTGDYDLTQLAADSAQHEGIQDLKDFAEREGMRIMLQIPLSPTDDEETSDRILLYLRDRPKRQSGSIPVMLDQHCADVSAHAGALAERLVPELAALFREAGILHDLGKSSPLWQRAMGNCDLSNCIAKPLRWTIGSGDLAGYRHELGSLVEALRPGRTTVSEAARDLLLHLIASHHGHARPHYPDNAHDQRALKESEVAMMGSVERFGRLAEDWVHGGWPTWKPSSRRRMVSHPKKRKSAACWQRSRRTMNGNNVPLDPQNPGHFYACCGLIELFDMSSAKVQSRFAVSADRPRIAQFELRSDEQMDLSLLLDELRCASFGRLDHPDNGVKPIRLGLRRGEILLDWWFDPFRIKTTNIKCWAGRVTTEKLMAELLPAIDPNTETKRLFLTSRMMKTRFGIDPRSAWNALDLGYSPNEHGQDAATYPLVEVLGAIGLQGFRPNATSRSSVSYGLWKDWLPRVPARRAATIGWPGISSAAYEFSIEKRGQSYKFFTFATPCRKENKT